MSLDGTESEFEDEKNSSRSGKSKFGRTVRKRPRLQRVRSQKRVQRRPRLRRVRRRKWVQWWPRLWRVPRWVKNSGPEIRTDLHLQVRGPKRGWLGTQAGSEIRSDRSSSTTRGLRPIGSGNWDWSSSATSPRLQAANQVRKLGLIFIYYKRSQANRVQKLRLIFIYYKSEVAGRWLGQEIGTDLHLLQVRGLRLIGSGNSNKLIKVKCLYIWNLIYI